MSGEQRAAVEHLPIPLEQPRTEFGRTIDAMASPLPDGVVLFADPDNRPCTWGRQAELRDEFHRDPNNKRFRVGSTFIGSCWVSTVWTGWNECHWSRTRISVYETMIFDGPNEFFSDRRVRHMNRSDARRFHRVVVAYLQRRDALTHPLPVKRSGHARSRRYGRHGPRGTIDTSAHRRAHDARAE